MTKMSKLIFRNACINSGGILSTIARRIGVDRVTVYNFIKKNGAYCQKLLAQERESLKDIAENCLLYNIQEKRDVGAAKWFLATQAKDRGYVEKHEISGNIDISSIEINFNAPNQLGERETKRICVSPKEIEVSVPKEIMGSLPPASVAKTATDKDGNRTEEYDEDYD